MLLFNLHLSISAPFIVLSSFSMLPNVRRYVLLAPLRGGACFCTRDALQGCDCYLFILALAKTVTPGGSPRGSGAGRTAGHLTVLFSQKVLAVRSGNCIYRPVVWSLFFYFLLSPKMSFRSCISLLSRLSNFFLFNSSSISFLLYSSINM